MSCASAGRHPWTRRVATVVAVTGAAVWLVVPPSSAAPSGATGTVGASGAGDPYFPLQGNGGYVVGHYDLAITATPATGAISGVATIGATTTQALSRFDLDLRRELTVSSVRVDGRPASFRQPAELAQELVVTPARPLHTGRRFTVVVTYRGVPPVITDPDGSIEGWVPTADGAFVVGEPQGSPGWYPCNDTPLDKAAFDVHVSVPQGLTAVSNGDLVGATTAGGRTTFDWHEGVPMSTYLATASIGTFQVQRGVTPGGIPYLNAVDPTQAAQSRTPLAKLPAMVDFFAGIYGPYPWSSTGAVVDDAKNVGYALETATRPSFDRAPDELTLAHEIAHQWMGDSVTVARWRDIWLNEGFAEWSSWYWSEHTGQTSAQEFFHRFYAHRASDDAFWNPPPANPGGGADIFDTSVYERGAMALQALRVEIHDDHAFLGLLRDWHAAHRYGNAHVADFTAFAERRFPRMTDLPHFVDVWLTRPGKPTGW